MAFSVTTVGTVTSGSGTEVGMGVAGIRVVGVGVAMGMAVGVGMAMGMAVGVGMAMGMAVGVGMGVGAGAPKRGAPTGVLTMVTRDFFRNSITPL
jgi:hypothetical protein